MTMGVYIKYTDEPSAPAVKDWNVMTIKMERHKRHRDRECVQSFWEALEKWMETRGKLNR